MPPGKRARGPRGSDRLLRLAGDQASTGPATESLGHINILAYPHILSLIVHHSTPSTITTLLRCSKVMLQTVSPSLYQNLRMTSAQFKAMLDCAWDAPKPSTKLGGGKTFSASLLICLKSTETLHLKAYDQRLKYPTVPRGCFSSIARVVFYLDEPPNDLIYFPTIFQSLGSHLFVRFTGKFVRDMQEGQRPIVILQNLPPAFDSATVLIPTAYRFHSPPSCRYYGTAPRHLKTVAIVLLPWVPTSGTAVDESLLCERWASFVDPLEGGRRATKHVVNRFVGAEYTECGKKTPSTLGFTPEGQRPSFEPFDAWLDDEGNRRVFKVSERKHLLMRGLEMLPSVMVICQARTMKLLEASMQRYADPYDPVLVELKGRVAELRKKKEAGMAEFNRWLDDLYVDVGIARRRYKNER